MEQRQIISKVESKVLHFKTAVGTSRGWYSERKVWYIYLSYLNAPHNIGIGECAPLPNLSIDDIVNYEDILHHTLKTLETDNHIDKELLRPYPSILFGIETALKHLQKGTFALWDTPFSRSEQSIRINGLIWMGSTQSMLQQIEKKLELGYSCLKLKIGAIEWQEEIKILQGIREIFSPQDLELRVDANGAFNIDNAPQKLYSLAQLGIHSIEQPIAAGQFQAMQELIASDIIPIALDEELIPIIEYKAKQQLLTELRPHYLILKPSLLGGFSHTQEWIDLANTLYIPWWMTSALESNIGLNAIAQWTAKLLSNQNSSLPQGLGTGQLFTNNIEVGLNIQGEKLYFETI